jgi:hypothetical protein
MWAMLRYLGIKSEAADDLVCIIPISFISVNSTKRSTYFSNIFAFRNQFFEWQRKKFKHRMLLEMEVIALSSELASFIVSECLEKKEYSPLHSLWSTRRSMGQSGSLDYCNFFFISRDRELHKYIWTITVTFVMFSVDGPIIYVVLVFYNAHRKFCKRTDTVIAFTQEYSRISYLFTGKQWLKKLIVHHYVSTNLVYQLD